MRGRIEKRRESKEGDRESAKEFLKRGRGRENMRGGQMGEGEKERGRERNRAFDLLLKQILSLPESILVLDRWKLSKF